jgi:hypothetical protein
MKPKVAALPKLRLQTTILRLLVIAATFGLGGWFDHIPRACAQTVSANAVALTREVSTNGWIAFGARTPQSDWDLFVMRPDGSSRRNLTQSPEFNEGLPRFSPDGRRLMYRRLPRGEVFDNNRHGLQGELVIAKSDGSEPIVFGQAGEYPWATWSPDSRVIACLSSKGIDLVELATKQVRQHMERKGFFQQITWSPDGKWLCGVANSFDTGWSIARMELATDVVQAICTVDCCTPDWFPDARRVVYSWRTAGQKANQGYGWTQLWMAQTDGGSRQLLYAEAGRHVYGGCASPDGNYVLFTGNKEEDGDPKNSGAPMGLIRVADAPIIRHADPELKQLFPTAHDGPVLVLPAGWEPHWARAELDPAP